MLDLLIRDGTIVDGQGAVRGSIGVTGGRIAARFATGVEVPPARQVIDARDLLVLPGIVDPHVHFYGEGIGGYSHLAVAGGVTTFIGMIRGGANEPLGDVVDRHLSHGRAEAVADFSFHVCLYEREDTISSLPALAQRGFRSFKMFLAYKRRGMMVSERFLFDAFEAVRALGGVALIHSEDGELVDRLELATIAAGRKAPEDYAPTRPPEAEAAAIEVVALAAQATGCPAYVVHVSSEAGLAALERARRRGVPLWAETCPQYILFNDEALWRHGPTARIAPPLRQPRDQRALATALRTGAINTLGSDHASYTRAAKAEGAEDIFAAPFGMPGAPTHFPSMFTFAQDNGIDLSTVVRAMSEAPARIFGLQRRKGSLAPGLDADLILVDPAARRVVDAEKVWPTVAPSPIAGERLGGWPEMTFVRGTLAYDGRAVLASAGSGQAIPQEEGAR
jgi:dihydroorotase (multifunctional complex type)